MTDVATRPHKVRLDGFCSINGGPDVACAALEVSTSSLIIQAQTIAEVQDKAVFQLPHIGLLEASVTKVFDDGFVAEFDPAPASKLGTYLSWLDSGTFGHTGHEARRFQRIVPIKRMMMMYRPTEPPSMVRIVDLSRSGVAFTTSKVLRLGDKLSVGRQSGKIVRLFPGGAAVDFDEMIEDTVFDVLIDLDSPVVPIR